MAEISNKDAIVALGKNIGGYFKNVGLAFAGRKVVPKKPGKYPEATIVSITEVDNRPKSVPPFKIAAE